MHVLFIGFVWPEPTSSAAGQNILSLMNICACANWQVSFASSASKTPQSTDFSDTSIHTIDIALNCASFNQQITDLQPDIVIFDRYLSFEQFASRVKDACPDALLVLDAEDLHGLREARHQYLKQNKQSIDFASSQSILAHPHMLYNQVMQRELACIYRADLTIVLSGFENNLLIEHFHLNAHQVMTHQFMLASKDQLPSPYSYNDKQDFMFIGNCRHAPNADAIRFLREQCWPAIVKRLQKISTTSSAEPLRRPLCHIYGAYLSPKIKQLEDKKLGFFVHGYAPSQWDVINQARIMLAPIRFGAGVKGKLFDAMQMNTPSVTSELGAEGILEASWPGKISKDVNAFVEDAICLYTNETEWLKAVDVGKGYVKQGIDEKTNSNKLVASLTQSKKHQSKHRAQNFMQQLLDNQAFQASKYMTAWIEAKS